MMRATGRTLGREIRDGHLILVFAILLICGLGLAFSDWLIYGQAAERIGEATAHILTRNLVAPMLFNDKNEINKTLASIENHPTFNGAVLLDKSQKTVAVYPETKALNESVNAAVGKSTYRYEVVDHGEDLGQLVLLPRSGIVIQQFLKFMLIVPAMLALAFSIALVIGRNLRNKINNQIATIIHTTQAIREQSNYSLRVPTSNSESRGDISEFRILSEDFNAMLDTVEQRDRQIATINFNLEETVEKRTEELKEAQLSLIQSSRLSALGEMSAGVAHEINNPLATIKTRASQLEEILAEKPLDEAMAISMAASITKTTDRIAQIVHGLKSFSRDGSADPFQLVNLREVVLETISFCQERLKNKDIHLEVDGLDQPIQINGIGTQISQVLLNLLNNASDAIEHLPERWIHIGATQNTSHVILTLTDSGNGIPEDVRRKIMQPFFTTKEVGKGTGLGLSISKGIIERHGGSLEINAASVNTQFVIRLPLKI